MSPSSPDRSGRTGRATSPPRRSNWRRRTISTSSAQSFAAVPDRSASSARAIPSRRWSRATAPSCRSTASRACAAHDAGRLQARVGAGTRIGRLAELLHGVGQALPNMGDIDKQSFGGALGTATHGSGADARRLPHPARRRSRSSTAAARSGSSTRRRIRTPSSAMGASLGAFGALTEVTINNMASYRLQASPVDDADQRPACRSSKAS